MEDSIKSKTQLKKEADDIQQFGIEISNLPNHKIKELSLSDEIIEAIIFYKEIKKNSAKRRCWVAKFRSMVTRWSACRVLFYGCFG